MAYKQLTLGELIDKLQPIADEQANRIATNQHEAYMQYDFAYTYPTTLHSWRGEYSHLALDYDDEGDSPKTVDFLKMLKDSIGTTVEGWKGGDYTVRRNRPLWVARPNHSGNTAIVDVRNEGYVIILITAYVEY